MRRAARSDPAGAARDPVDRLGAAVHPLVRHFRGLEDHADRGRRVLPGLSRRHGRDACRSTARSSRSAARSGCRTPPWCGASCCRRCCRPMCFRCAPGLGLGWMFVVAAELLGASEGLGYLLIDGQQLGKPAQIVAAIVAFAIIGKTTDWIICRRRPRRSCAGRTRFSAGERELTCSASNASARPIRTACTRSTPSRSTSSRARSSR